MRTGHAMVNEYVRRFGELVGVAIDPLDAEGYTAVCRGKATVGVNVVEDHGVLMLLSPLIPVPNHHRFELCHRLLELNFLQTSDASFAIDGEKDMVYVRALRGLHNLSFEEFADLLDTVATTADEWFDRLRREYDTPAAEAQQDVGSAVQ
jgi:hypothetical protein